MKPRKNAPLFLVLVALATACTLFLTGFRRESTTARNIIDEYLNRHGLSTKVENIKMVTIDSRGNIETREILRLFHEDDRKTQYSMLRFINPEAIRGVALLSKQETGNAYEQTLYLPALGQLRKISGSGQKGYFMGSDFAYEDLLPENSRKYHYARGLDDYLDDVQCFRITARPIDQESTDSTGYAKREIWISREDYTILKIEFYIGEEKLLKTLRFTQYKKVPGKIGSSMASRAEMTHHLKDTTSLIVVTNGVYQSVEIENLLRTESLQNWKTENDEQIEAIFNLPH